MRANRRQNTLLWRLIDASGVSNLYSNCSQTTTKHLVKISEIVFFGKKWVFFSEATRRGAQFCDWNHSIRAVETTKYTTKVPYGGLWSAQHMPELYPNNSQTVGVKVGNRLFGPKMGCFWLTDPPCFGPLKSLMLWLRELFICRFLTKSIYKSIKATLWSP